MNEEQDNLGEAIICFLLFWIMGVGFVGGAEIVYNQANIYIWMLIMIAPFIIGMIILSIILVIKTKELKGNLLRCY